jgi:hypothetical protein
MITLGYNKNCEMGGTPRSSTKYPKVGFLLVLFFLFLLGAGCYRRGIQSYQIMLIPSRFEVFLILSLDLFNEVF